MIYRLMKYKNFVFSPLPGSTYCIVLYILQVSLHEYFFCHLKIFFHRQILHTKLLRSLYFDHRTQRDDTRCDYSPIERQIVTKLS